MDKETAIDLLSGPTLAEAARIGARIGRRQAAANRLGITRAAIAQWPSAGPLPRVIRDRIIVVALVDGLADCERLRALAGGDSEEGEEAQRGAQGAR